MTSKSARPVFTKFSPYGSYLIVDYRSAQYSLFRWHKRRCHGNKF